MNEKDIFKMAEDILKLKPFRSARKKKLDSFLVKLCESYMDFLSKPDSEFQSYLSIKGEEEIAKEILIIYRLHNAVKNLAGEKVFSEDTPEESFMKEMKDLFSNDSLTFERTMYNLYIGSHIHAKTNMDVEFLPESNNSGERMPDLCLKDFAYIESKDLSESKHVLKNLKDKLELDVIEQLKAQNEREKLPFLGAAIDLPYDNDYWENYSNWHEVNKIIENFFIENPEVNFIIFSTSHIDINEEIASDKFANIIIHNGLKIEKNMFEFLKQMNDCFYVVKDNILHNFDTKEFEKINTISAQASLIFLGLNQKNFNP